MATVVVEALRHAELVKNKSFDLVSKAPGLAPPTSDFAALFRSLP